MREIPVIILKHTFPYASTMSESVRPFWVAAERARCCPACPCVGKAGRPGPLCRGRVREVHSADRCPSPPPALGTSYNSDWTSAGTPPGTWVKRLGWMLSLGGHIQVKIWWRNICQKIKSLFLITLWNIKWREEKARLNGAFLFWGCSIFISQHINYKT